MPLGKINLRPGVVLEETQTKNEGSWSFSQLVRFFAGQLQKLGGWARLAGVQFIGTCRGLFAWADLQGTPYLAVGTDQRLAIVAGGVLSDITPILSTKNFAPAIATVNATPTVTVTDATYQPAAGDWINIQTQVARGGLIIYGYYIVATLVSGTDYTITAASNATSTAASGGAVPAFSTTNGSATIQVALTAHGQIVGSSFTVGVSTTIATVVLFGPYTVTAVIDANTFQFAASSVAAATTTASENAGNIRIVYLLPSGVAVNTSLTGWGAGDWGAGDWGGSASSEAIIHKARTWSLDQFGQDLIASPDLGAVYYWAPPTITPALVLPNSPTINRVVAVMSQAQIVVAVGTEAGGTYFPTLVRWTDSGDFTAWLATATNQAGSYQLPTGSLVTSAVMTSLGGLIWTDQDLYSMTYVGLPFVFSFNKVGTACEAISKKAIANIGQMVMWPSIRGFFRFAGGTVAPVECAVWDFLYNEVDTTQLDQICSAVNGRFSEAAWYFPLAVGGIGYVKFNYLENVWDYGTLSRTAWIDASVFGNPLGTDTSGLIQQHEVSPDADGSALVSYATSGFYDLQDGTDLMYVHVVIPDFDATPSTAAILVTVSATDYPGEVVKQYGPFTATPTTKRINCSLRGRQVAFNFGSSDLGSFWRLGAVRYSAVASGRR